MSVQALARAFEVRGLSPSEKLVLLALANYANDKMVCWPSQERLADDTELSPRTVWAAIKALAEKQVVSRSARKRADGTRSTDVFTLQFEPLANAANTTRKSCEVQSQITSDPLARIATPTTFEPSVNHQIDEPVEARAPTPKPDPRGSRLADDWLPGFDYVAGDFGLTHEKHAAEIDKFRDYWRSVAGAKGRKSDWDATWRTWMRRTAENQPRQANGSPSTPAAKQVARHENYARSFAGAQTASRMRALGG